VGFPCCLSTAPNFIFKRNHKPLAQRNALVFALVFYFLKQNLKIINALNYKKKKILKKCLIKKKVFFKKDSLLFLFFG